MIITIPKTKRGRFEKVATFVDFARLARIDIEVAARDWPAA
jgi:hypothetical protein